MIRSHLNTFALILSLVLFISCEEEEPPLVCPEGAFIANIGDSGTQACAIIRLDGYHVSPQDGTETLSLFIDFFPYGNMDMRLQVSSFEDVIGTEISHGHGVAFWSAHWGLIRSGTATVIGVDRANNTVDIDFDIDALVLSNNTEFLINGAIRGLKYE